MTQQVKSLSRTHPLHGWVFGIQGQTYILSSLTTLVLAAGAVIIMIPFLYLLSTSVKDRNQLRQSPPPILPMAITTVKVNGQKEPLYRVNVDGQTREMALIKNRPGGKGLFVDPLKPGQTYELVIAQQTALKHIEI